MNPVNGSQVAIGYCHCGDPIVELAGVATSEDGKTVTMTTVTLLLGHSVVAYMVGEFVEQESGGVDLTIRDVVLEGDKPAEDRQHTQNFPELPAGVTAFFEKFMGDQNAEEQELPKLPDSIKQVLKRFDSTEELPKLPDSIKQLLEKFDKAEKVQESALASNEG